jgi:hypothetical protein
MVASALLLMPPSLVMAKPASPPHRAQRQVVVRYTEALAVAVDKS